MALTREQMERRIDAADPERLARVAEMSKATALIAALALMGFEGNSALALTVLEAKAEQDNSGLPLALNGYWMAAQAIREAQANLREDGVL